MTRQLWSPEAKSIWRMSRRASTTLGESVKTSIPWVAGVSQAVKKAVGAFHFHHAHAAYAAMPGFGQMAQGGYMYLVVFGHLQDCLSRGELNFLTV